MTNEVDTRYTQERELSWLRFDERVLAEAEQLAGNMRLSAAWVLW